MNEEDLKLWPFIEAKKLLKRISNSGKSSECIFQTGYGPSGLPHIGTFGEVLRTSMVIRAFRHLTKIKTRLIVFSDDMDGLRKVPKNIPNSKIVEENIDKPLSNIPDPFEKFSSFAEHNNTMLTEFLNRFDFEFEFKSATKLYKNGDFNSGLEGVFENYDKIMGIILPTLRKERRETYSPFLPVCKDTGKVIQVKVDELDKKRKTILFRNPNTKKLDENSIFNGECKLQWKVDWAMRWKVLSIDYEMNGKDLIESYMLSSKINKIIGGQPPCNYTYEHFLDEKGEKISKSIGNGISVDDWLKFSPRESLEYFMFQNPNRAKKLFFDVIPKTTDEFLKFKINFSNLKESERIQNPLWFVNFDLEENIPEKISFNMILNLASVCNAENSEILWDFINNYYPNLDREKHPMLQRLLEFGVNYFLEFVRPSKKYRDPNETEKKGFIELINFLKKINKNTEAEVIQTKIYDIGMSLNYEKLKDWFSAFYEVILGQAQGPRLGSFIKFYGIDKTIELLENKLN